MKFNRLAFVVAFVLTTVLFAEVAVHAQEAITPRPPSVNRRTISVEKTAAVVVST